MSDFSLVERAPQPTAVVRATIPVSEIPSFLGHAYETVLRVLASQGIAPSGEPFTYYPAAPTATVELEAGFPVAAAPHPEGEVVTGELPGGMVATGTHVGPYDKMADTYNLLMAWIAEQGFAPAEGMWEIYQTDPQREPDPTKWRTQIFWPVTAAPVGAAS